MAEAKIIPVGPDELELIAEMYNQVFSPGQEEDYFRNRFRGRRNAAMLIAQVEGLPAGFVVGFELMPNTYFIWICGVLPDMRRAGIATQLMHGVHAWAKDHHYSSIRFECRNQHRPMLHVAITEGYDLVGIRWDPATANNFVIFEKELA